MTDWEVRFYEDENGREPVVVWLRKIDGHKRRAITAAIEQVLAKQGPGVCRSGWGKVVAPGIFELRLRYDYPTVLRNLGLPVPEEYQDEKHADILLRVFCHAAKGQVVLLLAAYDKGKEPGRRRQQTEIALAQKRLKAHRALEAKQRKQDRRGRAKGKRRT